jgi:hypothetical protein
MRFPLKWQEENVSRETFTWVTIYVFENHKKILSGTVLPGPYLLCPEKVTSDLRVLQCPLLDTRTYSARSPAAQTLKSEITAKSGGTLFEIWAWKDSTGRILMACFSALAAVWYPFWKSHIPKRDSTALRRGLILGDCAREPLAECIIPTWTGHG